MQAMPETQLVLHIWELGYACIDLGPVFISECYYWLHFPCVLNVEKKFL